MQMSLNRYGLSIFVRCPVGQGCLTCGANHWLELNGLLMDHRAILGEALLHFLSLLVLALTEEALVGGASLMLRDVSPVAHRDHVLRPHTPVLGWSLVIGGWVEDTVLRFEVRVLVAATCWRNDTILTVYTSSHIAEVSREWIANCVVSKSTSCVICTTWIHF